MSILRSKLGDLDIPENVDISTFLFSDVQKHAENVAIIDDATGEKCTYGSLLKAVDKLAWALYQRGIRKGDVVSIFAEKSILGTAVLFSIFKLGAVMTPCRPSHTAREIATQLQDSQAKMIISDKHLMGITKAAVKEIPTMKKVLTIGKEEGYEDLETLVKTANADTTVPKVQIDPKTDLLAIIYSSGTTGLPKGVKITHYTMVSNTALLTDPRLKFFVTDVFPQTAPPYHIAGLMFISGVFRIKKQLVLYTVNSVVEYLKTAKHYKIVSLVMMPNHLLELSKLPVEEIKKVDLDWGKIMMFTGGSVFNAVNTKEVMAKTNAKALIQGYGATESGFLTMDDVDNFVPGSAGEVICNTELKIVDVSTREILGPHKNGEICVKGPCVTIGYFNNPKATEETFENGWFKSGDVGYYDETGHVFIVDRIKDVIKYKIMQVAPSEIEEVIYTHPAVMSACVVPVQNDEAGEIPLACIILKDEHSGTEQQIEKELIKMVEDNLAEYKRLRGGVRFMKEFPLTGLGKIIRRELRDKVQEERNQQAK